MNLLICCAEYDTDWDGAMRYRDSSITSIKSGVERWAKDADVNRKVCKFSGVEYIAENICCDSTVNLTVKNEDDDSISLWSVSGTKVDDVCVYTAVAK